MKLGELEVIGLLVRPHIGLVHLEGVFETGPIIDDLEELILL
jgi:hypothetical protein